MLSRVSPKSFTLVWSAICLVVLGTAIFVTRASNRPVLSIAIAMVTALVSFGAAPLFFMGLKDFKDVLRRAYLLLCIGIILYAIGQLQFPVFEIINGSAWVNSGGAILPFLASIVLIFWGMRRIGKLLAVRTLWQSPFVAFGSGIAVAVLLGLVVHGDKAALLQLEALLSVVLFFGAMIALKVRSIIAARYRSPIVFMAVSYGMLAFTGVHDIATTLLLSPDSWYLSSDFNSIPTLLAALFFFKAGYEAAAIGKEEVKQAAKASPVDVITFVAGIVSRPTEVDALLDDLRRITAETASIHATLTPAQEKILADTYLKLEDYLIEHEPLQRMDKQRLRQMVRNRFFFEPNTISPFWLLFK